MKLLFACFIFLVFLLSSISSAILAQEQLSTPLTPESGFKQKEIGLVLGLGSNIQSGIFLTECNCSFDNGILTGLTAGLLYEHDFFAPLQYGAALLYNNRSVMASYQEIEKVGITSQTTNLTETHFISFRQKSDASFHYLTLMPYIKWTPADFFFVKIGLSASYLFSSHITQTKELLTKTLTMGNGEIVSASMLDAAGNPVAGNSLVIEDRQFPQTKSISLSADPMIGFTFPLSANIFLSPVFQFSIPLTDVSGRGDSFRIYAWRVLAEFRWALRLRKS
jgi:hypothetical protein